MDALNWRKASYSASNGGGCVEAASTSDAVLIRDTTDRDRLTLRVPASAWRKLVASIKAELPTFLHESSGAVLCLRNALFRFPY